VIIPLKRDNIYIRETLDHLRRLDYPDFEVIVLPDEPHYWGDDIRVIPTGPIGPAAKRDVALLEAQGEILAFLDDDTYPESDWLRKAVRYFEDEAVAAVGGPAVTPPDDGPMQQASGHVYSSPLGGGTYAYRYVPRGRREVDDYPTCNLLVRRWVLEKLGGFDTRFWPGEDTKLCLEITRDLGMKILYAPEVLVYHHRRPLFRPHLRQVRSYALHRGYFAKRFPETSLRLSYFLPTLLVAGVTGGGVIALVFPPLRPFYLAGLFVYLIAVISSATVSSRHPLLTPLVAGGIIATHLVYGIWFVAGLLASKLSEEGGEK
jgi:cellulose synthase/poly-beta-1,6-N-acetylglucosamine synthase-like glycosyltransferase